MKISLIAVAIFLMGLGQNCNQEPSGKRIFAVEPSGKNLIIIFDQKYLTTLNLEDSLYKPFFWPINSLSGITITRGYPFDPVVGEPADHPHQTGLWFNFGNVNGLDFWNNSNAVPVEKKDQYGRIESDSFQIIENNSLNPKFEVYSKWKNNQGKVLLFEKTIYTLEVMDSAWSITRNTIMTADTFVSLHDNKEGLFAIRLAREFQFDIGKPEFIVEPDGSVSKTRVILDENKNGMYTGSNGTKGNDTWGTTNEWVEISTIKDQDSVAVLIIDHPDNFGYPSCWHARNYGLFSVNNFGRKAYRPDLPEINRDLNKGETLNLKHKIVIKNGGSFRKNEIERFRETFHSKR